jgi:hypothetical protein
VLPIYAFADVLPPWSQTVHERSDIVDQVFCVIIEAMRTVREGSESTGRTVRMCLLFVIFLGSTLGVAAWLMYIAGT